LAGPVSEHENTVARLRAAAESQEGLSREQALELIGWAEGMAKKLERLRRLHRDLDQRLATAENSLSLRIARRVGTAYQELAARFGRAPGPSETEMYRRWLAWHPPANVASSPGTQALEWSLPGGEYTAIFDPGGVPTPRIREIVAQALARRPLDLLYGDEDLLADKGARVRPIFRPDFSPQLLESHMYIGRFLVASRALLNRIGTYRDGYDLALRAAAMGARIGRTPEILYHARQEAPAVAPKSAPLADGPWVSLIICSRNGRLLNRCLRQLRQRTRYPRRESIVVAHQGWDDRALAKAAARHGASLVPYQGEFHFARMCNLGAKTAKGDVLVFLNDDVVPLEPEWLGLLVGHVQRPAIGAVGAKLLYPSGLIQHAGVALGIMDGAGHPGRGTFGRRWWPWFDYTRDVSAVTGACLAIRKNLFLEVSGFDERFPVNYNDVDLCLRLRRAGFRVIVEPQARLRHDEARSRVARTRAEERELFLDLWGDLIVAGDPFYHPALAHDREDASLALPA